MAKLRSTKTSRIKACELAALVMSGAEHETYAPKIWSLCVFFENYIDAGANGTYKDFGPKPAKKLKLVLKGKEKK